MRNLFAAFIFCALLSTMTSAEQQRQDILNAIADDPVQFVFSDTTYTGTTGPLSESEDFIAGGVLKDYDLSLLVCLQDADGNDTFGADPLEGDLIVIDGVTYAVKRKLPDQLGVSLRLYLENALK